MVPKQDIRSWKRRKNLSLKVLTNEENQFNKTIDQGLRILGEMEDEMKAAGEKNTFRRKCIQII